MPRQARLDAPGTLHHVIARGIERRAIFWGDRDRDDFLSRLEKVSTHGAAHIFAWALMPNHFHLLIRTGPVPLSRLMRRLMSGYAIAFNLRHDRHGHLFQNRYKSIVCEAETYLLELVRYIHLNPLRGGQVNSLVELRRYPYSGHGALLGEVPVPWQDTGEILRRFGGNGEQAGRAYEGFVAAGVDQGYRAELVGGVLGRSTGPWPNVVPHHCRGQEEQHDSRILGSAEYVEALLREVEGEQRECLERSLCRVGLPELVGRAADAVGISVEALRSGGRKRAVQRARTAVSQVAVGQLGYSGADVARYLGVATSTVNRRASEGQMAELATRLMQTLSNHVDP